MIGMLGREPASSRECSRAGCLREADWALRWRNPRIHTEDRRKTWLACGEHRDYLRDFLEARSFPLEVLPLSEFMSTASPDERDG